MKERCLLSILAAALCGLATLNAVGVAPITESRQTRTVRDREVLAHPVSWTRGVASLLLAGSATTPARMQTLDIRNVYYSSKTVGIGLALLSEPTTKDDVRGSCWAVFLRESSS